MLISRLDPLPKIKKRIGAGFSAAYIYMQVFLLLSTQHLDFESLNLDQRLRSRVLVITNYLSTLRPPWLLRLYPSTRLCASPAAAWQRTDDMLPPTVSSSAPASEVHWQYLSSRRLPSFLPSDGRSADRSPSPSQARPASTAPRHWSHRASIISCHWSHIERALLYFKG